MSRIENQNNHPAEVRSDIFLRFLCQECREIWREILVKFSECLIFQCLGLRSVDTLSQNFTHKKNGAKSGKFHESFTLLGGGNDSKEGGFYTKPS